MKFSETGLRKASASLGRRSALRLGPHQGGAQRPGRLVVRLLLQDAVDDVQRLGRMVGLSLAGLGQVPLEQQAALQLRLQLAGAHIAGLDGQQGGQFRLRAGFVARGHPAAHAPQQVQRGLRAIARQVLVVLDIVGRLLLAGQRLRVASGGVGRRCVAGALLEHSRRRAAAQDETE
ncbi:hypothetical protein WJ970_34595 [Achromobacter xylosoxidans]